eukprot:7845367-Prorocentrum_lima.AAC.1
MALVERGEWATLWAIGQTKDHATLELDVTAVDRRCAQRVEHLARSGELSRAASAVWEAPRHGCGPHHA